MFGKNHHHYIKSQDDLSLYSCTNFDPKDHKPDQTVLIFNYGLICSNSSWVKQIEHFDKIGLKILLHDYRGHFNSQGSHVVEKITFDSIITDLNTICDSLGVTNAILFGHSMGVNICLEFVKKFPQKVKAQILISGTTVPPENVMFDSKAMKFVFPILKNVLKKYPAFYNALWESTGNNPINHYFVHRFGFHSKQTSREFVKKYINKATKLSPTLFFQLLSEMNQHDIIDYLPQIKSPTLIIGGDRDQITPLPNQRFIHTKIPNSKFYLVKEGSHVPQVDFYQNINERIDLFLENLNI